MSSIIALREGKPPIPGTPSTVSELRSELRPLVKKLGVIERLEAYGDTLRFTEDNTHGKKAKYIILQLDAASRNLAVFTFDSLQAATDQYSALERSAASEESTDVVLVSVESAAGLRRDYPNYFLDARVFLDIVKDAIRRN